MEALRIAWAIFMAVGAAGWLLAAWRPERMSEGDCRVAAILLAVACVAFAFEPWK